MHQCVNLLKLYVPLLKSDTLSILILGNGNYQNLQESIIVSSNHSVEYLCVDYQGIYVRTQRDIWLKMCPILQFN